MTRLKLISFTFIFIWILAACSDASTKESWQFGTVSRVIDGDTIELENGDRVRYLGINTPETSHPTKGLECFGNEATEFNRNLVEGKQVKLLSDGENEDKYGRLLRYVFVDGIFVNGLLVWEGMAFSYSYGKPLSFYQTLVQLERGARENGRGLWVHCEY